MLVRITLTDTGTGETQLFDREVADLSLASVIKAVNENFREIEPDLDSDMFLNVEQVSWVPNDNVNPDHYAFVFKWHDVYSGNCLVYGVVYTNFL